MKSAVRLSDFSELFGDLDGHLPDGQVLGSNWSDWPEVIRLISRSGWTGTWFSDGAPVAVGDINEPDRLDASFTVHPIPTVRVDFFLSDEVLFDIDRRELVDQVALDAICEVVARLGASLGKPVTISYEGNFDDVVLRYEPRVDEFTMRTALMH
ncbi:MAG TPA: hypothetical protein VIP98_08930 [Microlunatus sp.]